MQKHCEFYLRNCRDGKDGTDLIMINASVEFQLTNFGLEGTCLTDSGLWRKWNIHMLSKEEAAPLEVDYLDYQELLKRGE